MLLNKVHNSAIQVNNVNSTGLFKSFCMGPVLKTPRTEALKLEPHHDKADKMT